MKKRLFFKRNFQAALFLLFVLVSIVTDSCKKDLKTDAGISYASSVSNKANPIDKLTDAQKISSTDIAKWLSNAPGWLTVKLDFKTAEQSVINGNHVVKIKLNKSAALFFTKENGQLLAFAYKWLDNKPGEKLFTGKIASVSFQDYTIRTLVYNSGQIINARSQNLINSPATMTVNSLGDKLKTNTAPANIWDAIARALCFITGGYWSEVNYSYGCAYDEDDTIEPDDDAWTDYWTFSGAGIPGVSFGSISSGGGGGAVWVSVYEQNPTTPGGDCPPVAVASNHLAVNLAAPGDAGCPLPSGTWVQYLYTPTISVEIANPLNADWSNELDNEIYADPNPTVLDEYQETTSWPTINRVIPYDQFVPHRRNPNGKDVNCLVLAREQLAIAGYKASGWLPGSQTFQTYSASNGVNLSRTKQAITYLINSLSNHIPAIVGVDAYSGSVNSDGITDHFMVIDGMGTEPDGRKYFHFIDNSTNSKPDGNSSENKLYYNATTGLISGKTKSGYPGNIANSHDYIVTQIRKSILQ